jgi:hypothetical protein
MLKTASRKAAGELTPEAYPLGYVEDVGEPRTTREVVFSILLEARSPFVNSILIRPKILHLKKLKSQGVSPRIGHCTGGGEGDASGAAWFPSLARGLVGCCVVSLALGIETCSILRGILNGTSDIDATAEAGHVSEPHSRNTRPNGPRRAPGLPVNDGKGN